MTEGKLTNPKADEIAFLHHANVLYWREGAMQSREAKRNISAGKIDFEKSGPSNSLRLVCNPLQFVRLGGLVVGIPDSPKASPRRGWEWFK